MLALVAACASCVASSPSLGSAAPPLAGTDGAPHDLLPTGEERYVVLIFFSADCQVLAAHDERIRGIAETYVRRGFRFLAVDPEVGATLEVDAREVAARGYPFPIVLDRGARLAKAAGALYAGQTFVIDRSGRPVYQGGIDSDRTRLTNGKASYLVDALDDLLAGRPPRVAQTKVLGCALRTW